MGEQAWEPFQLITFHTMIAVNVHLAEIPMAFILAPCCQLGVCICQPLTDQVYAIQITECFTKSSQVPADRSAPDD